MQTVEQVLTHVVVRPAEPGGAVSVMLAIGEQSVEVDLGPVDALGLALALVKNARVAAFGEFVAIDAAELLAEHARPAPGRLLDMAVLQLAEVRERIAETGMASWPQTPGGSA